MKVAVVGASGWLGGAVAREALARGHEVTAIGRDGQKLRQVEGARVALADIDDPDALRRAISGSDAVVVAVTDRSTPDRSIIPRAARSVLGVLPRAGVSRILALGGGGSLELRPGVRALDEPGFPERYKAEALAQAEALDVYRHAPADIDWTYLSPPAHDLVAGEKTDRYRVQGGDAALVDDQGESRISSGDLAAAAVDELEQHRFSRSRFTAAY